MIQFVAFTSFLVLSVRAYTFDSLRGSSLIDEDDTPHDYIEQMVLFSWRKGNQKNGLCGTMSNVYSAPAMHPNARTRASCTKMNTAGKCRNSGTDCRWITSKELKTNTWSASKSSVALYPEETWWQFLLSLAAGVVMAITSLCVFLCMCACGSVLGYSLSRHYINKKQHAQDDPEYQQAPVVCVQ